MHYGNKKEFWDEEVQKGLPPRFTPGRVNLLYSNQIRVHSMGFREAGLCESIFGYSVRLRSGLCENQVLFGGRGEGRHVSYEEALEWGKSWVDDSPDFRVLNFGDKCQGCTLDYHKKLSELAVAK